VLANFILFPIGWFACVLCVLGAAHDRPWLGTGIALAIVGLHVGRAPRYDAPAAGAGTVPDSRHA
jgi:hypothetical protein